VLCSIFRMQVKYCTFMVKAAVLLYKELSIVLKSLAPHLVAVLKASLSLILFSVAQLKALCPSDDKYQKEIISAFIDLKSILWNWIVSREVIGGSLFGGTVASKASSWKTKEELEVIIILIRVHTCFDFVPPSITRLVMAVPSYSGVST